MTKEQARKILDIFLSEDGTEVLSIEYLYERNGEHYFELETKVTEKDRILPNGVESDGRTVLMVCKDGNVLTLPM